MARTIKPNRQFFGVSVDTPAGNTQVTSEMLQGLSSVEQRVAALTNTAFDVVDVQMKEQGKQDAIDNPIDLQEWLQSSPKERKILSKAIPLQLKVWLQEICKYRCCHRKWRSCMIRQFQNYTTRR